MNVDLFVQYLLAAAIVFDASIAWFVFLKNPKQPVNQAYFVMILCISLWQISNFVVSYFLSLTPELRALSIHLSYAAVALLAAALLYFVIIFPSREHQKQYAFFLMPFALLFAGMSFLHGVVRPIPSTDGTLHLVFGWLYPLFFVYIIAAFITALVIVINYWLTTTQPAKRKEYQFLLLGLAVPLIFGSFTNLFVPLSFFVDGASATFYTAINNFGVASTVFLSATIAYAVLRHRFLQTNVIIKRTWIAVGGAGALLFGVLFFALTIAQIYFPAVWSQPFVPAVAWIIGLIALLFCIRPTQYVVERFVKRIVKQQLIDVHAPSYDEQKIYEMTRTPERAIPDLAARLLQLLPLDSVTFVIYDHAHKSFRVLYPVDAHAEFAIDEPWLAALHRHPEMIDVEAGAIPQELLSGEERDLSRKIKRFGARIVCPLQPHERMLGAIFVGPRADGKPFTVDDLAQLRRFWNQTSELIWAVLQMHHLVRTKIDEGLTLDTLPPEFQQQSEQRQLQAESERHRTSQLASRTPRAPRASQRRQQQRTSHRPRARKKVSTSV